MPNLLIIPSIDLKNGKAVRVIKGIPEINFEGYTDDAITMGMLLRAENAKCIHLVDFDASNSGSRINYPVIEEICNSVIIPIQIGGGIRTFEDAKTILDMGVYRIVIGSMIHDNPDEFKKCLDTFGPSRVVAAMDVKNSELLIHARSDYSGNDYLVYARMLKEMGVERIVVSDIASNGKLCGPNLEYAINIANETGIKITHAGGISGIKDVNKVKEVFELGIDSLIVGRALCENKFQCQKLWRLAENGIFN